MNFDDDDFMWEAYLDRFFGMGGRQKNMPFIALAFEFRITELTRKKEFKQ